MSPLTGVVIGKDKVRLISGTILTINCNKEIGKEVCIGFNYSTMKGNIIEIEEVIQWQSILPEFEEEHLSFPAF